MKIYDIANQEFISVDNDAPPITSVDAITNRIAAVVGYFVVGFIYVGDQVARSVQNKLLEFSGSCA
jgi:uncharacterized membrane protein SirB2